MNGKPFLCLFVLYFVQIAQACSSGRVRVFEVEVIRDFQINEKCNIILIVLYSNIPANVK